MNLNEEKILIEKKTNYRKSSNFHVHDLNFVSFEDLR